jgi:L-histidine N-alpha-methyltransferase
MSLTSATGIFRLPDIAGDVAEGLSRQPKSLPPRLFYDAEGSRLFEAITRLPEYYLTRTERAILQAHATAILNRAGTNLTLIELGAGTATKTGILIAALCRRQMRVLYYPIDVSATALEIARTSLQQQFPNLKVTSLLSDFTNGLELPPVRGRKLVLFLGSSIGNFEPEAAARLLRNLRSHLNPQDALLIGTDLVKHAFILVPAYNDNKRVTAQFNLNILNRINRELGGHFNVHMFRHVALWNRNLSRMEMYLESTCDQVVPIDALAMKVTFRSGERIHTENSYKYTPATVCSMLNEGGFQLEQSWKDSRNWFALHLARAV